MGREVAYSSMFPPTGSDSVVDAEIFKLNYIWFSIIAHKQIQEVTPV